MQEYIVLNLISRFFSAEGRAEAEEAVGIQNMTMRLKTWQLFEFEFRPLEGGARAERI